jgi:signal transduction histidine kinase
MPRRLFLALLLLVAAPLVLLGWVSATAVRSSQRQAREELAALLSTQLLEARRTIHGVFESYARELSQDLESDSVIAETLRRMRRENPIVRQGMLIDSKGRLSFPTAADTVDVDSMEVAAALPGLIDSRPLKQLPENPNASESDDALTANSPRQMAPVKTERPSPAPEWIAEPVWQQWFMADGAQVVYWRFRSDGSLIGILLERSRWMSDLIAALPDQDTLPDQSARAVQWSKRSSPPRSGPVIGSIELVDESQRVIYRWGQLSRQAREVLASKSLSSPLSSWQLRLQTDPKLTPNVSVFSLLVSLLGVGVVVIATGIYVLTSVQRQLSVARRRVSFAGQVSHELRTPLTNIRLYTELAEADLENIEGDLGSCLRKRLHVIDRESRRLQRLVSGVLEMMRPGGKQSGVRIQTTDLCQLVDGIADQFAPGFQEANLTLAVECNVTEPVELDPDVVEMVLVNLLSNVEKYVPAGGACRIECERREQTESTAPRVLIRVLDDGPGILEQHRRKVFRPFVRLDDSINAPSGTGIGLTIARRAAARHHGELRLMRRNPLGGAAFELMLPLPPVTKGAR